MNAVVNILSWLITNTEFCDWIKMIFRLDIITSLPWNVAASRYDSATNERLFCTVNKAPGIDILKKSFGLFMISFLSWFKNFSVDKPCKIKLS